MADPFVAEVIIFPFNFAPKGWAWCNGQLLPITQNTALFSLLGTMYGGDGKSTFALPDLQGRAPMHTGQGAATPVLCWRARSRRTPTPLGPTRTSPTCRCRRRRARSRARRTTTPTRL